MVRENASRQLPSEDYDKFSERREKLKQDSFEIGSRLEEAGVPAFDRTQNLSLVCPITGEHQPVEAYRNICFIPSVAKKRRSAMLRRLDYFASLKKNEGKIRMWVFNTGIRARISECDDRIRMLNRNVAILASELREKYGIDIFFRATELGSAKRKRGYTTLHPHAHVLVKPPYVRDWSGAISWVNRRWRQLCEMSPNSTWKPFEEAGKLFNIREACKYVCKPDDLKELTPEEYAELYGVLYKKHLVQPLGEFKRLCAHIRQHGLKPVRRASGDWELVYNWNKRTDSEVLAQGCPDDEDAKLALEEDFFGDEMEDRYANPEDHRRQSPSNQILAVLEPSFYFGNRCSPALLVSKRTDSFLGEGCSSHAVVQQLKQAYEEGLCVRRAGRRPSSGLIGIHNRSITSEKEKAEPKKIQMVGAEPPG